MYAVAERLDPGTYFTLARAVYAEMALAGISCVGEFHYLHHGPGGKRYSDPNETGRLLIAAAAAAGLRITLLDACYLAGGFAPVASRCRWQASSSGSATARRRRGRSASPGSAVTPSGWWRRTRASGPRSTRSARWRPTRCLR